MIGNNVIVKEASTLTEQYRIGSHAKCHKRSGLSQLYYFRGFNGNACRAAIMDVKRAFKKLANRRFFFFQNDEGMRTE